MHSCIQERIGIRRKKDHNGVNTGNKAKQGRFERTNTRKDHMQSCNYRYSKTEHTATTCEKDLCPILIGGDPVGQLVAVRRTTYVYTLIRMQMLLISTH